MRRTPFTFGDLVLAVLAGNAIWYVAFSIGKAVGS